MNWSNRFSQLTFATLLFTLTNCTPVVQNSTSYPNPSLEKTEVPITVYSPTPRQSPTPSELLFTQTPNPNDIPPELLFTPTPDLNAFTINAEIDQKYSQEKIVQILLIKWLDHFKDENISLEMRLDEYVINQINIPLDQKCAKKTGGVFVAEANITLKTTLPVLSSATSGYSEWVSGSGNIVDANHITKIFSGVISKSGNTYTLVVITQIPMCD